MKTLKFFVRFSGRGRYGDSFSGRLVIDMDTPEENTVYIPFQSGMVSFPESIATRELFKRGLISSNDKFIHDYCHENGIAFSIRVEKCRKPEAVRFGLAV